MRNLSSATNINICDSASSEFPYVDFRPYFDAVNRRINLIDIDRYIADNELITRNLEEYGKSYMNELYKNEDLNTNNMNEDNTILNSVKTQRKYINI